MNKIYEVEGAFSSKMKLDLSDQDKSSSFNLKGAGTRIEVKTLHQMRLEDKIKGK